MVWVFAYPAYMQFPGQEVRDFYPVFSIFISWTGVVILIFLGFSSKRFRAVFFRCCNCCQVPSLATLLPCGLFLGCMV
jgi:hypothetical protein